MFATQPSPLTLAHVNNTGVNTLRNCGAGHRDVNTDDAAAKLSRLISFFTVKRQPESLCVCVCVCVCAFVCVYVCECV